MPKNATNWSNNDIKTPATWTGSAKNLTRYTNNVTKNATAYTQSTKQNSLWSGSANTSAAWLYDDATQKYDDTPVRGYDYLVPATNTVNNLVPTGWAVVV